MAKDWFMLSPCNVITTRDQDALIQIFPSGTEQPSFSRVSADSGRPCRAITTEGSTVTNPSFPTGGGTIVPQYRPLRLQAFPNSTSSSNSPSQRSEEGDGLCEMRVDGEVARRFRPFGWRRGAAHVEN